MWHIMAAGNPHEIREDLRRKFQLARDAAVTSDEMRSVVAAEFMVNRHLDFAATQRVPDVTVEANGVTSYKGGNFAASVVCQVRVELIWGFVPDADANTGDDKTIRLQ